MTCHEARDAFSALVDEALTPAERAALDAHIQGCAECRRELDRFRGTVALLRAIEPARAPIGFVDRVLAVTRPDPWPRRLIRRLFLPLPVKLPIEAALVVLVAVTAVYVFQQTPELQQAARQKAPSYSAPSPAAPPARPAPSPSELTSPQPDKERPQDLRAASPGTPRAPEANPPPAPPPRRESPTPSPGAKKTETPALPLGTAPSSETASALRTEKDASGRVVEGKATGSPEGGASRAATPGPRAPGVGGPVAPGATEPREGAPAEAAKSPPQPSVHRFATRALISVDVSGRLLVKRREAAGSALTELIARVGGTELGRRPDPAAAAGEILELLIPRATYAEFVQGLGRLGDWRVETELAELPDPVRVVVRMTD